MASAAEPARDMLEKGAVFFIESRDDLLLLPKAVVPGMDALVVTRDGGSRRLPVSTEGVRRMGRFLDRGDVEGARRALEAGFDGGDAAMGLDEDVASEFRAALDAALQGEPLREPSAADKIAFMRRFLAAALNAPGFRRPFERLLAGYAPNKVGSGTVPRLMKAVEEVEVLEASFQGPIALYDPQDGSIMLNSSPDYEETPALVASAVLFHELMHKGGLGEFAAHKLELLFSRWMKRGLAAAGLNPDLTSRGEAYVPVTIPELSAINKESSFRAGRLHAGLVKSYGRRGLTRADDRLAVAKHRVRRDLRVKDALDRFAAASALDPSLSARRQEWLERRLSDPLDRDRLLAVERGGASIERRIARQWRRVLELRRARGYRTPGRPISGIAPEPTFLDRLRALLREATAIRARRA